MHHHSHERAETEDKMSAVLIVDVTELKYHHLQLSLHADLAGWLWQQVRERLNIPEQR